MKATIQNIRMQSVLRGVFLLLALQPYVFYIAFIIQNDRAAVDYETFMAIGSRFLHGEEVYQQNSYYPLPMVMVFAFFSWLPRSLSMALWVSLPVLVALWISNWDPLVLLFAPMFSHFTGGQTALFGMLGLWGHNRWRETDRCAGGFWLAIMTLKPQLAILPIGWAVIEWGKAILSKKRLPRQANAFIMSMLFLYLPSFVVMPDWVQRWLSAPRPLFLRALSGFAPRTLIYLFSPDSWLFWFLLASVALLLFFWVWKISKGSLQFKSVMIASFIVNPFVHDYDLIQMLPLLNSKKLRRIAVLASLPGWLVILFAYQIDMAWYLFTLIAPIVLIFWLKEIGDDKGSGRVEYT